MSIMGTMLGTAEPVDANDYDDVRPSCAFRGRIKQLCS